MLIVSDQLTIESVCDCARNKIELNDSIAVVVPLPELCNGCKICWPDQCQEQLDLDSDQYESAESYD